MFISNDVSKGYNPEENGEFAVIKAHFDWQSHNPLTNQAEKYYSYTSEKEKKNNELWKQNALKSREILNVNLFWIFFQFWSFNKTPSWMQNAKKSFSMHEIFGSERVEVYQLMQLKENVFKDPPRILVLIPSKNEQL